MSLLVTQVQIKSGQLQTIFVPAKKRYVRDLTLVPVNVTLFEIESLQM